MNSDFIQSAIVKAVIALGTYWATKEGLSIDGSTWQMMGAALAALAAGGYRLFQAWDQKKVPANSVAVKVTGVQAGSTQSGGGLVGATVTGKVVGALAVFLLLLPASGRAADMRTKAPVPNFLSTAYPQTSGIYFGVGTMGGGGSVNASVPGINSASLVTNQISANGLIGYAWNVPNSKTFLAVEGWFGVNNFNGSTPGFSFNGPATFTQRVLFGAPLEEIMALFPNLNLAVPPFPALPGGQTATNIKPYIGAHMTEDDITIDVLGSGSNRDWRFAPGIDVGALGQLSSGSVVDVFANLTFPQKDLCVGTGLPGVQACGRQSTMIKGGLAIKW